MLVSEERLICMIYEVIDDSVLDFSTQDLLCAIKEISIILARFKKQEELVEFIKSLDIETGADTGTMFRAVRDWKEYFSEEKAYRFFQDVIKALNQDYSIVVETLKQSFIDLIANNVDKIKLFVDRNGMNIIQSVFGSGCVFDIYEAVNNAIVNGLPFTVVEYDVSEQDSAEFALMNLNRSGNFGVDVRIVDVVFTVIVPITKLDIITCS
jgi:hypothetical protein